MEARGGDSEVPEDGEDEELDAKLVRYADRADRLTLHPSDADDVELMATWLTADADAFVELDERR